MSPTTGYVLQGGFHVFFTRNSGRKWTEIESTGTDHLSGLSFAGQGGPAPATPGVDYFASALTFSDAPSFAGFFSTTNGGASPQNSSLSISIGPKKLTPAKLKKAGHQIKVKGKLSPVTTVGETVQIAHRTLAGSWATADVRVASNGAFSFTIHGVKKTTDVVAHALGDGVHGGAGALRRREPSVEGSPVDNSAGQSSLAAPRPAAGSAHPAESDHRDNEAGGGSDGRVAPIKPATRRNHMNDRGGGRR